MDYCLKDEAPPGQSPLLPAVYKHGSGLIGDSKLSVGAKAVCLRGPVTELLWPAFTPNGPKISCDPPTGQSRDRSWMNV